MVDRAHRELTGEEMARIADTYHGRMKAATPMFPAAAKSASMDDIRKHGHVLTPGRYVGVEHA